MQIIVGDVQVTWSYDSSLKRLLIKRMVQLFSRFSMVDPKSLCFDGAKKNSLSKHPLVNEMLNATEIQQSIIEMSFVRVYFG